MYQVQYPTNYELKELEPDLMATAQLTSDPIFKQFPITSKPVANVEWTMKENIYGLQAARGLDGEAPRIQNLGESLFSMVPGVYGEQTIIGERELTTRAPYDAPGAVIAIDDLVVERMKVLIAREVTLIRQIIWTMLTTGTFSIFAPSTGAIQHTDTFAIKTASVTGQSLTGYTAPTGSNVIGTNGPLVLPQAFGSTWATIATSTPLLDLQMCQQLWERGTSCRFGVDAEMFMNRNTFNLIVNSASLGVRWVVNGNGGTQDLLPGVDTVKNLFANFNLPAPVIMNDGYLDSSKVWQYYIPNNVIVFAGTRPNNDLIGEYVQTRNASNPDFAPGPYIKIKDEPDKVPRNIQIDRGHNGGPAIYYPNAIGVLTVA